MTDQLFGKPLSEVIVTLFRRQIANGSHYKRNGGGGLIRCQRLVGYIANIGNKSKPFSTHSFDVSAVRYIVLQRNSRCLDRSGKRPIGDWFSFPDRVEQFTSADKSVGISGQIADQFKDLGFGWNDFGSVSKFETRRIKFKRAKAKNQIHVRFLAILPTMPRRLMASLKITLRSNGCKVR